MSVSFVDSILNLLSVKFLFSVCVKKTESASAALFTSCKMVLLLTLAS